MRATFYTLGWRVEITDSDENGIWKNVTCELEAEVANPYGARIRRKYVLGWNGKKFSDGEALKVCKMKNPRLLAEIEKYLGRRTSE